MTDKQKIKMLVEALKEIKKGEGAFSRDRLNHANNTIENMKQLAEQAIAQALDKKETATEVIIKAENSICPECGEYCPGDEGVKNGMKCGTCAY